jgi:hypothetical protein
VGNEEPGIGATNMTQGDETVRILLELQKCGFTDDDFRALHHMGVTMAQHIKYSAGKKFQQGSKNEFLLMKLRRELQLRKIQN